MNTAVIKPKKGKPRRGAPYKYPWDKWLRLKRLSLRKGVEFTCPILSFMSYFKVKAWQRGLKVRFHAIEDGRHYVAVLSKGKAKEGKGPKEVA
jgi:hypothetical protein